MDIKITAPEHPNQERLVAFYRNKIENKFNKFRFLTCITVKVSKDEGTDEYKVSLHAEPIKGKSLHATGSHTFENTALLDAVQKMEGRLERYKEIHYKSSHRNQARFQS